jgi:hypothetical protein
MLFATFGMNEFRPAKFISSAAFLFLAETLRAIQQATPSYARIAKFIIPLTEGQIVRSDIVPRRLVDFELVESAVSFAEPLQHYRGQPLSNEQLYDLHSIFRASTAGLILRNEPGLSGEADCHVLSPLVDKELINRLSFPWIINRPILRKRLAIVEGGFGHPDQCGTGPNIYLAAKALGINIIVLDNTGHWLEGPEFSDWRESFIPTILAQPPDEGLADRIVASVQSYEGKVDGVITFCDAYQVSVAKAAQRLGFATPGPEAYEIATNKYNLSIFEGRDAYRLSGPTQALKLAASDEVNYPAILKPCNGWCSEGVERVDSIWDFLRALERIQSAAASRHGNEFVIEPYCSGPEVDANFVLQDGEILFFEVSDDLPKTADVNGNTQLGKSSTFLELTGVYPSQLPAAELSLLRASFHNTLLRLGLTNGVMHLEGRVDNSDSEYRLQGGLLDLHPRETGPKKNKAAPWLIEINPRPPGLKGAEIIEATYGIDYWGLALIIAVSDKERAKVLTQPFLHGPQYTSVLVMIQPDYDQSLCEGIFDSDDICIDLCRRRPDLAKHISSCGCFVKKGQKVPHPSSGIHKHLAYFNVFSKQGRIEALRLAEHVRQEVRPCFR